REGENKYELHIHPCAKAFAFSARSSTGVGFCPRCQKPSFEDFVFLPPNGHDREHGNKSAPVTCERILAALESFLRGNSRDDVLTLKITQLVGENLAAGFRDFPQELAESQAPSFQSVDNHGFPFAVDDVGGLPHRAFIEPHGAPQLLFCAY